MTYKRPCSDCGEYHDPADLRVYMTGEEADELHAYAHTIYEIRDRITKHHLHYHKDQNDCCMFIVADLLTDIGLITPANKTIKKEYLERKASRDVDEEEEMKRELKIARREFRKANR